jgi:hypothetical protein
MNYDVVPPPNYNAPVMDFASFLNNNGQRHIQPNGQPQIQPSPPNVQNMPGTQPTLQNGTQPTLQNGPAPGSFLDRLKQFLSGPHGDQMVGRPSILPSNPPVQPTVVGQDRGDY